jgi:hypothetical protein
MYFDDGGVDDGTVGEQHVPESVLFLVASSHASVLPLGACRPRCICLAVVTKELSTAAMHETTDSRPHS